MPLLKSLEQNGVSMFENMVVTKGPDRWKLAESLFSWDEMEESHPSVSFHVDFNGKSALLTMQVWSVALQPQDKSLFRISGLGQLRLMGKTNDWLVRNAPVEVCYSTHDRDGMVQVKF